MPQYGNYTQRWSPNTGIVPPGGLPGMPGYGQPGTVTSGRQANVSDTGVPGATDAGTRGGSSKPRKPAAAPLTPAQQAAAENKARFPSGAPVPVPMPPVAPTAGPAIPTVPSGPLAGLEAAAPSGGGTYGGSGYYTPGESGEGGGPGIELSAPGALRQGIGNRMLPSLAAVLGLRRVY